MLLANDSLPLLIAPASRQLQGELGNKPNEPASGVLAGFYLLSPILQGPSTDHIGPHCRRPLIEIDYYGERLIGCVECNRWGRPRDDTLPMQLLEDDLEALRARRQMTDM